MSLLKRIETVRSGASAAEPTVEPTVPAVPADPTEFSSRSGPVSQTLTTQAQRLIGQVPVRESFREVKFRVQSRRSSLTSTQSSIPGTITLSSGDRSRRSSRVLEEEGLRSPALNGSGCSKRSSTRSSASGPLEQLLRDETVTEIMVNGPRQVYIERRAGSN